jgi:hypothetical protein
MSHASHSLPPPLVIGCAWYIVTKTSVSDLVFPKRSATSTLVVRSIHAITDRYSLHHIPVRRPISPIRLFLRIGLVRLAVELDEKHQVPREESTANQGGILIAPAVAKDWEVWGVLVCEMHVGGEVCCKEVEYKLGYLHRRDVFLPLLGGCQMQSARMKKREARTQIFAPPAVA